MANHSTDFLRFSAYSIKDLITRKLSEDTKLTDQIYEGSNASILIDLISYMYQCLVYQLNNAASESMFMDTQVYKNIVRLVKLIGYNPHGCQPSVMTVNVVPENGTSLRNYQIPFYSCIDTGLTDHTGKKIYFSTKRNQLDQGQTTGDSTRLVENSYQPVIMYNGRWKLYNTIFTASGVENETFVLDGLASDATRDNYVAHNFIDIFVQHYDGTGEWKFQRDWELDIDGIFSGYSSNKAKLFNNETIFKSLYPGTYHVYQVYLNEDKTYELKFGNGIVGAKLSPGDKVYVFYLDTNGLDGQIDTLDLPENAKFVHNPDMFGMSSQLYSDIFGYDIDNSLVKVLTKSENSGLYSIVLPNGQTTKAKTEEGVDEIRDNAPNWFTTGNRLVTKIDYEYYLKNNANGISIVGSDIVDVKCMNNWEYLASFYKWLYHLGTSGKHIYYSSYLGNGLEPSPQRYLTKENFLRYNYLYADSADANNLYLWLKTTNDNFDPQLGTLYMNQLLDPIKLMTAELVVCKVINVMFDICAAPEEYAIAKYLSQDNQDEQVAFDEEGESYIEITLDDNAIYVANSLQKEIYDIIVDGFNINNCSIGQNVSYSKILEKIYSLNGVSRVKTVFRPSNSSFGTTRSVDGLAFASWSAANDFILTGDDISVSNTSRQLEPFQFPVFNGAQTLMSRIKIIKKSLSTINTIKF